MQDLAKLCGPMKYVSKHIKVDKPIGQAAFFIKHPLKKHVLFQEEIEQIGRAHV